MMEFDIEISLSVLNMHLSTSVLFFLNIYTLILFYLIGNWVLEYVMSAWQVETQVTLVVDSIVCEYQKCSEDILNV